MDGSVSGSASQTAPETFAYAQTNIEEEAFARRYMWKETNTEGRGYLISTSSIHDGAFIPGTLHIEADTGNWQYDDDDSAARAAQRDGIRLVYGIPYVEDGIYLDTPENRVILRAYSERIADAVRTRQREDAA